MLKVLIVEDDRTNQALYRRMQAWQEEGFEVVAAASNGKEACQLVEKERFDMFLVDIMMPEMNGLEFLAWLKEGGYEGAKIIASNYNEFEYVRGGMKQGAMDYLLKPFSEEELSECLKRVKADLLQEQRESVTEKIFKECGVDTEAGFVKKLMAYFEEHCDASLTDISDYFALNKDYFGRLFKKQMNESFNQFALKYKMEYAKYLLESTDDKVYEIGDRLGFKTSDYFSKLFKDWTGLTPADYRKNKMS